LSLADVPSLDDPSGPPGEIISGGLSFLGRHFAVELYCRQTLVDFAYSTIASGNARAHLFASARFAWLKLRCSLFLPVPSLMQTRRSNSFYCQSLIEMSVSLPTTCHSIAFAKRP